VVEAKKPDGEAYNLGSRWCLIYSPEKQETGDTLVGAKTLSIRFIR
jgi:hypothetical protein